MKSPEKTILKGLWPYPWVGIDPANMSHPEFFAENTVYTPPCHCEAQFEVCLTFIQLGTAASPKQSPCSEFVAKSEQEDCFVASVLQSVVNVNSFLILPKNAPRSDELKRKSEFVLTQTQIFGMTHASTKKATALA